MKHITVISYTLKNTCRMIITLTVMRFHFFIVFIGFSFNLFLLNLLGWQWLVKLYRFQVHYSIIHHLLLYCVFTIPSQVSFHHHLSFLFPLLPPPQPLLIITMLVSVSIVVCFFFWLSLLFFTQLHNPTPLWQLSVYSLSMNLFLFFLLVYFVH